LPCHQFGVGRSNQRPDARAPVAEFCCGFVHHGSGIKGVGKLLSKPKVITQNNERATVKQGTKSDSDDHQ